MDLSLIKAARKAAKLTQLELAEKLGINRATLSKYETGGIIPRVDQLERIADICGVRISYFQTDKEM